MVIPAGLGFLNGDRVDVEGGNFLSNSSPLQQIVIWGYGVNIFDMTQKRLDEGDKGLPQWLLSVV